MFLSLDPCVGEEGKIFVGQLFPVPEDCTQFYECDVEGLFQISDFFFN